MHYTREDGCRAWLAYGELQPAAVDALLREYGSCESVYDSFRQRGRSILEGLAGTAQMDLLAARAEPDAMHQMMLAMQKWEMGILSVEDYGYPDALRDIDHPPRVLFYRGDPDCLAGRCVTMVGARSASVQGIAATRAIARELSRSGVCIVSGMAHGIDTAALEGALEGGSPAVGVLGCGLDVDYPAGSRKLKERMINSGGVLLTEYPPGTQAMRWHFPVRNRIMAGLSSAVVMMEGRIRSGSMTTVQHALDQGREVFAYPGTAGTEWAEGAHQLLREGANYFTSAADILEDLGWQAQKPSVVKQELPTMTAEQQKIFALMRQGGEMSFDQLAAATGLEASALSGALTMLQIMGLIESLPGKVYKTA